MLTGKHMESLCSNCINCESAYKFNGSRYVHTDICVYDLSNFGRAQSCPKYETTALDSFAGDSDD